MGFVQLARAITIEKLKTWTREQWESHWLEPKIDGLRLYIHNGKFFSRNGKPFYNLGRLEKELSGVPNLNDYIIDGEISSRAVFRNDGADVLDDWSEIMSVARSSVKSVDDSSVVFSVFDCMSRKDFEKKSCNITLFGRRELLRSVFYKTHHAGDPSRIRIIPATYVQNFAEFREFYEAKMLIGFEGIMIKRIDSLYTFDRSTAWLKVKPTDNMDCLVVGFSEGLGKFKGMLGALEVKIPILQLPTSGKKWSEEVTHVSGMIDLQRHKVWDNKKRYLNKIVEVKFASVTEKGRLKEARFVRWRFDQSK